MREGKLSMFVGACSAVAAGAAPGVAPGTAAVGAVGAVGAGIGVGSVGAADAVGTAAPSLDGWQGMSPALLRWRCAALVRLLWPTMLVAPQGARRPLGEHHGHNLHLLLLLLAVLLMLLNVAMRERYLYPS